jgi:tetratricopeptide (TPR) repeat protein
MNEYKISFNSLLVLLFLLPLFFIPSASVPLSLAKPIILFIGVFVGFVALLAFVLKRGEIRVPRHWLVWTSILLPLVYFVSAFLSGSSSLGLYGYNFEVGTFVSILLASVVFLLSLIVSGETTRILKVESVVFFSLFLTAIFTAVKILSAGKWLVFNTFVGATATPLGDWSDLGIALAMLVVLSLLALEMLEMTSRVKTFMYGTLVLSVVLLSAVNYPTAWWIVLLSSLVIMVYFLTMEKPVRTSEEGQTMRRVSRIAVAIFAISLLFVFNPTISPTSGTLGSTISSLFGVSTGNVSPNLSTTLTISGQVLKAHPLFGSGPNTFGNDWLLDKPLVVNQSNFWNTPFTFGFGFLATQISSVGFIGSLLWLAFFLLFLWLAGKALSRMSPSSTNPLPSGERFVLLSTLVGTLILWGAMCVYVPNIPMFVLAFAFTGLFLSASASTGIISWTTIAFSRNAVWHFLSVLLIVLLGVGSIALGFIFFQKSTALVYYNRAGVLVNTPGVAVSDVENDLAKAINLSPTDVYYRSLADLELSKAQTILGSTTTTLSQTAQTDFQNAISKSIAAANASTQANPFGYTNWTELGSIYEALVPKPLAVQGAYDSAKSAYQTAQKLNPESPEPNLLLARLELDNGSTTAAQTDIQNALTLKNDYADAYFLLTQLEASANNITDAIKSAQTASILSPDNAGIFFELGLLEYSNTDYADAETALTQALVITPGYANAEYFLGLSLDKLGQPDQALVQFEALDKANPNNPDIEDAIANIEAGRDALYKAPSGAHPEKQTTPPLGANVNQ